MGNICQQREDIGKQRLIRQTTKGTTPTTTTIKAIALIPIPERNPQDRAATKIGITTTKDGTTIAITTKGGIITAITIKDGVTIDIAFTFFYAIYTNNIFHRLLKI